jgi:asparagine synthase (glutamine-hydrolysing)
MEDFQVEFEKTFKRVLPRYFDSRSPVGISLTAGLDSRMIMACLSEGISRPICYTFSGQHRQTLDARLAARVAAVCGLHHETISLGGDFLSNFASCADETIYITDGYLGAFNAHEIYLNRKASALAPVRVTGVFGGEILREVSFLRPLGLSSKLVSPDFAPYWHSLGTRPRSKDMHPVTSAAFHDIPERRFATPAVSRSQLTFRTPFLDNDIVSLAYRIPKALRASLRPALSLIRRNSAALAAIPTDQQQLGSSSLLGPGKRLIARVGFKVDCVHAAGLPRRLSPFDSLFKWGSLKAGVVGLHKFVDYREWVQRELSPYVISILKDPQTRASAFWNQGFLERMADGRADPSRYVGAINAIATLQTVDRLLFRQLPRS